MSEADLIPTGQYYIRSSEDVFAGRNKAEDLSLNPKRVFCPTDHPGDPDLVSTLWNLNLATSL